MKKAFFFLFFTIVLSNFLQAQLEGVRVETYYVSDANDATDTIGGLLETGSTTYRIFIDLLPGSKLRKVYGDEKHVLFFGSTESFFNHKEEGESFGYNRNRNRLGDGTAALDSWLTIGQVSKSFSGGAYFAIPKEKDTDGSVVGGVNNDGGSEGIAGGLLVNDDPVAGIPLTTSDGLVFSTQLPNDWIDLGFVNPLNGEDNSIFGSNESKEFTSNFAELQNSGTTGLVETENEVIIAQLTTKGDLSFKINLEIEFESNGTTQIVKYVATDSMLTTDEVFNPLLNYPWTCGCTDPDFLEARSDFACEDNSLCRTPAVLGCMDTSACNYNPIANINIKDLCCYVGYCNDRDISLVCPDLPEFRVQLSDNMKIFPNPSRDYLNVSLFQYKGKLPYAIYDSFGRERSQGVLENENEDIDVSFLEPGLYHIRFVIEEVIITKSISIL